MERKPIGFALTDSSPLIIDDVICGVKSLDQISNRLRRYFSELKKSGANRIGFLAGTLGDFNTQELQVLNLYSDIVSDLLGFPVFSPGDILTSETWSSLTAKTGDSSGLDSALPGLFVNILGCGITDVIMTPEWDKNPLGLHIYDSAFKFGLPIHSFKPTQSSVPAK